jgi:CHAD domain-containing protein
MSQPLLFTYTGTDWPGVEPELSERLSLAREEESEGSLTYFDTFDWRLYQAGFLLVRTQDAYELSDRATGAVVGRGIAAGHDSVGVGGLPPALRRVLSDIVGVRALLEVSVVQSRRRQLAARNSEEKTVARLELVDAYRHDDGGAKTALASRISVVPLRGYEKSAIRLSEQVMQVAGVEPSAVSIFDESVAATGRLPGDYSSGLSLRLGRDMPAVEAARLLYRAPLEAIVANQDGVVNDIDSEFLHDLRVAVRRTRSALKELPGMLSSDVEAHFREEFRWLGRVTSPTRDLDVYLLELPAFAELVGGDNADLEPLRRLIAREKRRAHTRLRRTLRSVRYQRLCLEWGQAVDVDHPTAEPGPAGSTPIGELADARIRRVGRKVLRDGGRIVDESPAEMLHDLRKRCKELRYLLEFFNPLYGGKPHRSVLVKLKGLQANLGQFQDTQLQRRGLEGFADQLLRDGQTPVATLLTIGRLMVVLEDQERLARAEFADRFRDFGGTKNRRRLARLTGGT